MTQQTIEYHDGETRLSGYLSTTEDSTSPKPAVLVCPDWSGRNAFADQKADAISQLGYVGFAVDIYGEGQVGQTFDEKAALMQPFLDDRSLLRSRLLAAFTTVQTLDGVDDQRVAVMGFCFGGLCALDLARSGANIKAAISFHGLLNAPTNLPSNPIQAKVLALHGYDDPMVPPEQVQDFATEMTKANVDWQIHMYGNVMHAFTNPQANDPGFGTVYNDVAAERSVRATEDLLKEIF